MEILKLMKGILPFNFIKKNFMNKRYNYALKKYLEKFFDNLAEQYSRYPEYDALDKFLMSCDLQKDIWLVLKHKHPNYKNIGELKTRYTIELAGNRSHLISLFEKIVSDCYSKCQGILDKNTSFLEADIEFHKGIHRDFMSKLDELGDKNQEGFQEVKDKLNLMHDTLKLLSEKHTDKFKYQKQEFDFFEQFVDSWEAIIRIAKSRPRQDKYLNAALNGFCQSYLENQKGSLVEALCTGYNTQKKALDDLDIYFTLSSDEKQLLELLKNKLSKYFKSLLAYESAHNESASDFKELEDVGVAADEFYNLVSSQSVLNLVESLKSQLK